MQDLQNLIGGRRRDTRGPALPDVIDPAPGEAPAEAAKTRPAPLRTATAEDA